jgi:tRNA G10  N-methylase Trm11
MLRHFFQMFVDENTRLLDPTCGGGSALRAAESLGASQVLGLEINKEYADNARVALKNFRNLRKASK